jgi:nitrogen-specific signal transduction histidine kinase
LEFHRVILLRRAPPASETRASSSKCLTMDPGIPSNVSREFSIHVVTTKAAGVGTGLGLSTRISRRLRRDVGHEINNRLTEILGSAAMLLSHRERLHLADVQRLQVVVDPAVRLRETMRRINAAWEHQTRWLKSA